MTKTEQLAEKYANANYNEYTTDKFWGIVTDRIPITRAYRNGAQDMLERACEWIQKEVLEDYEGVIWSDIVKDFRKAMEE